MLIDHFTPPASHPLHRFVLSIFRLRARTAFRTETILPKGNVDILFNLGPAERVSARRGTFDCTTTLVTGLHTRTIVVTPGRHVHIVGVSLRPETCFAFLHAPADDFADTFVEGSLVLPDADALLNRLGESATFAEQRDGLLAWLRRRLRPDDQTALVAHASQLLRRAAGAGAVGLAARGIGMSRRHLQRLFTQRVGVAPTDYVRLTRFAQTLPLLSRCGTLADVAARAGYFDQAHFCRDFRTFAGMAPHDYRRSAPVVPGHLFSP